MNVRFRRWRRLGCALLPLLWVAGGAGSHAADAAAGWGPPLGSAIPLLRAADQDGNLRELANLSGQRGLLVLFNRSADW